MACCRFPQRIHLNHKKGTEKSIYIMEAKEASILGLEAERLVKHLKECSPKIKYSVVNYSPSCRSKPVITSFILETQIKIFLMKSESSDPPQKARVLPRSRHRKVVRTSVKWSMWLIQLEFYKATRTLCAQRLWLWSDSWCLWRVRKLSDFIKLS